MDVEQRAREILAAQCEADGMPEAAEMVRAGTFKGDAEGGFNTTIRAMTFALSQNSRVPTEFFRTREMNMAMTVEEVAKIISGAPFPSKQSLAKARAVVEFMDNRAALTPPEGFVLVPVVPTEAMLDAEHAASEIHVGYGEDYYVENPKEVWAAMIAARPEVPDGRG